jgi:enoyl-CoA hydratase/carnithine racemase
LTTGVRSDGVAAAMLRTEVRDAVAWVTLDRAAKLNAMTRSFWGGLHALLSDFADDDGVRVVVFHGAGRCFSVGGDMDSFGELGDAADRRAYVAGALGALQAVEEHPKPTIAAVHGHALGGGCELTMVCDIVVADETASFGTPEVAIGLVPGLAVARGRAQLNAHWLRYLVLTGLPLDARQAQAAGLVNSVVAAGGHLAEAERLAATIARRSPRALAVGKRITTDDAARDYARGIDAVAALQGAPDFAEAVAAFRQLRDEAR